MKDQMLSYGTFIQKWLHTCGVDFGLRFVTAAIILLLGTLAIKMLTKILRRFVAKVDESRKMIITFVISVVIKTAWALLTIVILEQLGISVGPILAGLGVTGFILGFAFQESLSSLASGLMLALNNPFQVGDYVIVAGHEGTILKLDMMAVTLATSDNRRITVPNKIAWGSPIVNFSALELRRVDIAVGVSYGCDLAKAKSAAVTAMRSMFAILDDPAPTAEIKSLGESAVILTVRGWVKTADYWTAYFTGNQLVKEALDKAGISIPFPQVDVHITRP